MQRNPNTLLISIRDFAPFMEALLCFEEISSINEAMPEDFERTHPDAYVATQEAHANAITALETVIDTHVALTVARALGLNATLRKPLYECNREVDTDAWSASRLNPELAERPNSDALNNLNDLMRNLMYDRRENFAAQVTSEPQVRAAIDHLVQVVRDSAQRAANTGGK